LPSAIRLPVRRLLKIKKIAWYSWTLRAATLAEIVKTPLGLPRSERGIEPAAQDARDVAAHVYRIHFLTFLIPLQYGGS
jgi:hypothetical protein